MKKPVIQIVGYLLLVSTLLAACTTPSAPQPAATVAPAVQATTAPAEATQAVTSQALTKIKISVTPFLSYAPIFIAKEEGFFAEQGFDVEFVRFDKTAEAIPALAQGQIDVVSGEFNVSTLNAVAQGGDIKYVSDKGFLDPNGCSASTFVVRKDILDKGTLNDLKNIKGMKVALTPASTAEYALDVLLKSAGLSSKDVEVLNIPLAARLEGMGNGSVDIAAVSDPWTVRMVNAGYGEVWNPWEKLLPNLQFSVNMYGPNFLKKNPEFGKKYMIAYLKGVRQYNQGKTDRNVDIIAKYTQMKPEEVKQSCWMSMRSDGSIDISGMSSFEEWTLAKGLLVSLVPPESLLDLSFVQSANDALK
jgi:NitT/TauT family transport system substrate-binding protein